MRNILTLIFISVTLCFSCSKKDNGCGYQDDNVVAPAAEQQAVKAYLDSMGIVATLHESGFYYVVVHNGSGNTAPGLCSSVTVNYKGQLTTGGIFDQQYNFVYTLGGLIDGWKKGLPLIKTNGEIRLYVPPTLGYGSRAITTATTTIPANSILIFDINLLNVQ